MKNKIFKSLFVAGLITLSVSGLADNQGGTNYEILFAKAQSVIESIPNITELKNLPDNEKVYFLDMYVISLKSGEIVSFPSRKSNDTFISSEEAIVIVDNTVKAWQFDESKTVYTVGGYLSSVVVTKSRDVYVLVIPDIYQSMKFKKSF